MNESLSPMANLWSFSDHHLQCEDTDRQICNKKVLIKGDILKPICNKEDLKLSDNVIFST